jgi:8-oxo-dGTP diphosphatase
MKKTIRVVGCILKHQDQVLLLHRSETETDPSLWGVPAGKSEEGESDIETVIREVQEETSIKITEDSLNYLGILPIDYGNFVVCFPIFSVSFTELPDVSLDPEEHVDYKWMKPHEIIKRPDLMRDVDIIIKKFCIEKLGM